MVEVHLCLYVFGCAEYGKKNNISAISSSSEFNQFETVRTELQESLWVTTGKAWCDRSEQQMGHLGLPRLISTMFLTKICTQDPAWEESALRGFTLCYLSPVTWEHYKSGCCREQEEKPGWEIEDGIKEGRTKAARSIKECFQCKLHPSKPCSWCVLRCSCMFSFLLLPIQC